MAYATYSPAQSSSSWNYDTMDTYPQASSISMSQEDEPHDPVRAARNNWVVQHTNASDSSDIIDSIDVDMVDASQDESANEIYLVLDTNVLIDRLVTLKQALARIEAPNSRLNVVMVVPGIVVSELDYQKSSVRGIAIDSRRASDWLAGEIGNGRGYVKGQAYSQTMLPSGDWRQRRGLSNDELILDCCKYFGHVKRKDVILCTSDNNLAVQASSNAANLFIRCESAVIRPPRELWDSGQLLERAVPGFGGSTAASIHASGASHWRRSGQSRPHIHSHSADPRASHVAPAPHSNHVPPDDVVMGLDMDNDPPASTNSHQALPRVRRDELHRQMADQLGQHLRKLTGKAASLQQRRRTHESIYSVANARFTGNLPTESDWSGAWSLHDCLKFMAKIPPPQRRSWSFGEAEASSLADFLGLPGEKGARPGREWAKHDWGRELTTVHKLAEDFDFTVLDNRKMAEYEYAVMEVFALD